MVAPVRAPRRSVARVLPPHPVLAALLMLAFTALLYAIELVDHLPGSTLDSHGIYSRSVPGLLGILWAPLLHGGWPHLWANTIPFLVFGFLAMAGGIAQWVLVTATIWLVSGLGVWLVGPADTSTIGASGVIFGWLVFLLARGFFARSLRQIALAIVLFAVWGSVLVGVLPGAPQISWQGHLFGALAGLLCAWLVARAGRGRAQRGPAALGSP
ncbi:MAG TPA: rhomboid family intramembrane serine protease [Pseudonocardia sp.]